MKKKIFTLLMLLLLGSAAALAQRKLACYPVFRGQVVPERQMTVTEVRGGGMTSYKLSYYKSVRFQADSLLAGKVGALVEADAAAAPAAETEKSGELLTYALVQLRPAGKTRRYLCYQARRSGFPWIVTLLYLEGTATPEDLRSMFEKQ